MTQDPYPHKVELLAPAGSADALTGAFSAGADAVYLGGERFGARAYADNFSTEEIIRAIGQAHVLDRKIYLTANVLTREEELPELVSFVSQLDEAGLDGVIVQDLGVLSALHEACPDLPLHASTQLSVTSAEAVRILRRLGVRRVVPARELSLKEIETLRAEDAAMSSDCIEIEAFIHGAMCYSYSGRCLMSSFLGGRSGNRGRCAGTCRLPYRILDENRKPAGPDARKREVWPLSMKDMCVLSILPELIDAGIDSFKIEGRMKKPVYAAGVTAVYRKYIDRFYAWTQAGRPTPWKVEEEDLDMLRSLYIRTELGTGYYHAKNGRNLVTIGKPGYAGTDAALEEEIRRQYLGRLPSRPVTGRAVFRTGQAARLAVTLASDVPADPTHSAAQAEAAGAVVQPASASPLTEEGLRARLGRTGDSMFTFSSLEIEMDDNIFLPVSAVNALRRQALAGLQDKMLQDARRQRQLRAVQSEAASEKDSPAAAEDGGREESPDAGESPRRRGQELWALVSTREQMEAARAAGCDCILVDGDLGPCGPAENTFSAQKTQNGNNSGVEYGEQERNEHRKIRYVCVLPPVFRVNNRERIRQQILTASRQGYSGILVRTLEELSLALQEGYHGEIIADSSLYSWNSRAMSALAADCSRIVCSLELNQGSILDAVRAAESGGMEGIQDRIVLPVYGRIPMMESAGCVRKTEKLCSKKDGFWYLEDRRGMQLPVRCRCGVCANTIYNAVPLSLHQFAGRGLYSKVPVHMCMFTTEDREQTRRILQYFGSLRNSGRKNTARPPFDQFTNGHYKTGAL
jgi:putative protease